VTSPRRQLTWPITAGLLAGGLVGLLVLAVEIARLGVGAGVIVAGYAVFAIGGGVALAVGATLVASLRRGASAAAIRAFAFGACLATAGLGSCYVGSIFGVGCEQLQSEGESLVLAIEQHREQTGTYPRSLSELKSDVPETRYGPWSYGTRERGFWLSVGDYGRDQLELSYGSGQGWYCDT
jgi:hypothetical protein